MTKEDKRILTHAVAKKLAVLCQGRIGYKTGRPLFRGDTFVAPRNHVCSQYLALVAYITGNSKPGVHEGWPLNRAKNKNYEKGYLKAWDIAEAHLKQLKAQGICTNDPLAAAFWGVSNMAYNRDIMSPTNVDKNKLVNLMKTKNINELKKLEGKVLMMKSKLFHYRKPFAKDIKVGDKLFKFYDHTVMIGPYNPKTGKLTIYQSTSGGTQVSELDINSNVYLDVYEFVN